MLKLVKPFLLQNLKSNIGYVFWLSCIAMRLPQAWRKAYNKFVLLYVG